VEASMVEVLYEKKSGVERADGLVVVSQG
jgi:hypothetical protein